MARFCTKCGAPAGEGMSFCTACGAPLEGAPAPPALFDLSDAPGPAAFSPSPVIGGTPVLPATTAPAAPKGSPIVKIVLIVVGILLLFGLLTGGACVYMLYRTKQRITQFEKQIQKTYPSSRVAQPVHEPLPAPTSGPTPAAASPLDLGIPVYPGATPTQGQGQLSMGGGTIGVQQYTTTDPLDKIVTYYKDKLGAGASVNQTGNSAVVQAVRANGITTMISVTSDAATGKTTFTISSIQR